MTVADITIAERYQLLSYIAHGRGLFAAVLKLEISRFEFAAAPIRFTLENESRAPGQGKRGSDDPAVMGGRNRCRPV